MQEGPAHAAFRSAILRAMGDLKTLPQRAAWLRSRKGVTAEVAADVIGISRGFLSGIETGSDVPGRDTLIAIADYYSVAVDWLATGRGSPLPGPLSPDEIRLLWHFRAADAAERAALLILAERASGPDSAPPDWISEPWRMLDSEAAPAPKRDRRRRKRQNGTA